MKAIVLQFFFVHVLYLPWAAIEARGDELLFRFEGDMLPHAPGVGWAVFNACEPPCHESLSAGRFVQSWRQSGDLTNLHHEIARESPPPPPTLWVEWRFRSNHARHPAFYTCDARFVVDYRSTHEVLWMYGDSVISFSGDEAVLGLPVDHFYSLRYECMDGVHFSVALNGAIFLRGGEDASNEYHYLQFGGSGGCGPDSRTDQRNEWDFIRYGTISHGERLLAADPPAGFLDPTVRPDRFTVTFDSPNYVYIDDIEVSVSRGTVPQVVATRRLDNGPPEVVEIVLDRPIPINARTRFIFNDGTIVQTVSYTYIRGDADADDDFDLFDFTGLQTCFGTERAASATPWPCAAFDFDANDQLSATDHARFAALLSPDAP